MESYKVGKVTHKVYDIDEVPKDIEFKQDWREGDKDDWVRADDDNIIQILRKSKVGNSNTIGTCTGTYLVTADATMDTTRKEDIHSVSGENWYTRMKNRKKPTQKEILFAAKIGLGEDPTEAYLAIFDTENRDQAKKKAGILIKTERIQKIMNEKLKDTFTKFSVDLDYLIESAKDIVDGGKNDSDRLKALSMLWDAYGVIETQKITEVRGVFQGFQPDQIEKAGRNLLGVKDEEG